MRLMREDTEALLALIASRSKLHIVARLIRMKQIAEETGAGSARMTDSLFRLLREVQKEEWDQCLKRIDSLAADFE